MPYPKKYSKFGKLRSTPNSRKKVAAIRRKATQHRNWKLNQLTLKKNSRGGTRS